MKISVIIPNYNNEDYIVKCLESVYNQTLKDIEIIVIDDGSTDKSVEKIEKYIIEKEDKIKLIKQFNQNASIARNKGIEKATGEYLYFLDSDDMLENETILEKIYNDITGYDLLIGNYNIIDENENKISERILKQDCLIDIESKYKYTLISPVPSNKLFKNDIIKRQNLYFSNVKIGQDLNFFLKYLSVIENIKCVDYYIYKYRVLQNSMSRKINFNIFDIYYNFQQIKKYYKLNDKLSEYNKYITIAELMHYNAQMEKLVQLKKKKEKKVIYTYFTFCIDTVDTSNIYKDYNYSKIMKKIRIKRFFKTIYISSIYALAKKTIYKKKKIVKY